MNTYLPFRFVLMLGIVALTLFSATTHAQDDDDSINANALVERWKRIGLKIEVPWRKSRSPGSDYSYIAQCRAHVGAPSRSGFKTEVTCEILGHVASRPHTLMISLEVWNAKTEGDGRSLAIKALDQIGVDVPKDVIQAFNEAKDTWRGDWKVVDESTEKLKEIRIYYRPTVKR